jgi:hypothetical protein
MTTTSKFGAPVLTVEVDQSSATEWTDICRGFRDSNVYQSWSYPVARSGAHNTSHLILRSGPNVQAICQVRIAGIPALRCGIAYVRWGPLWRSGVDSNPDLFREAIRALRKEYVVRRGLVLRILPHLFDYDRETFQDILNQEGYGLQTAAKQDRTILIDLSPTLEDLHRGLHQKWRYNLNKARKQNLEIIQGTDDSLFENFQQIYTEMVDRKQFMGGSELHHFRKVQRELPMSDKMRVILCRSEGQVCAGSICSALGETGIYLLGATSNRGIKTFGSYLVHWQMLEWLKQQGCRWYDLNGINPERNPGGYQFKLQLAGTSGRDVRFLGQFDAYPNALTKWFLAGGELLRPKLKKSA